MSSILKPVLGSQLQLGHPLACGLINLCLLNEGTGEKSFDLSGNSNDLIHTNTSWIAGTTGSALAYNGTNAKTENTAMKNVGIGVGSIVLRMRINTVVNANAFFWCEDSGSNNGLAARMLTDSKIQIIGYNTDGTLVINQATGIDAFTVGQWYDWAFTWDSVDAYFYQDGQQLLADNAIAGTLRNTDKIWIANDSGGVNFTHCDCEYFHAYNRMLSASEVTQLLREPFCMVKKKAAPVYFFVPTAPPVVTIKDIVGGFNLTPSGTVVAPHPRIIAPIGPKAGLGGVIVEIICTADGQSTAEAATKVARKIAITSDGQATAGASASVTMKVAGTADATSTAAVAVKVLRKVSGGADGQSTASGTVSIIVFIAGTADAQSTALASVTARVFIIGTADAQSTASITLTFLRKIICTADAQSTAIMTATGVAAIICTAAGQTTATCTLIATYSEIPPAMHEDLIKPYGDMGAWLWLVEIVVPTQATQRIARNTADVVYGVTTFVCGNFDPPGRIPLVGDGSIPRIQLRVAKDGTGTLEGIVNATKGGENGTVKLIRTCEKYFNSPVKALERTYDILTAGSDPVWVTFSLGIPNPLTQRIPLWSYSSKVCPLATPSLFKGPRCQYVGEETVCTGLLEDCRDNKNNAVHWGAEIGLDPNAVRV